MTLTRTHIVEEICDKTGYTKKQATTTVESLLEVIKKTLESGEDVLVSGFGKFCVNAKKERKGRNPVTGDDLMLRARKVVTFKCSAKEKVSTFIKRADDAMYVNKNQGKNRVFFSR